MLGDETEHTGDGAEVPAAPSLATGLEHRIQIKDPPKYIPAEDRQMCFSEVTRDCNEDVINEKFIKCIKVTRRQKFGKSVKFPSLSLLLNYNTEPFPTR